MQDIQFRDYQDTDFEDVNALWELTGMGGAARGDDAQIIRNTLKAGAKLLLMLYQNQLIGTSWMTHDSRRIYLHHFGIQPQYQGKGFSRLLLNKSLEFAVELNMQIKLEVHRDNEVAKYLYTTGGFTYLGDYEVHIIRDIKNLEQQLKNK